MASIVIASGPLSSPKRDLIFYRDVKNISIVLQGNIKFFNNIFLASDNFSMASIFCEWQNLLRIFCSLLFPKGADFFRIREYYY
jgi:hypothetical protein